MRFEDCIECGLCLSACPVAATDDSYVGPAALAFAQRMLEEDPGTVDRDALLDWADQDIAAWRCHAAFECTEACPSNVRPAQRIMALRKDLRRRRRDQGRAVPRGRIGGSNVSERRTAGRRPPAASRRSCAHAAPKAPSSGRRRAPPRGSTSGAAAPATSRSR